MEALVMMLKNTSTGRFHPMFYFESPLPGGIESDANKQFIRYKSKGHHTDGFDTRELALESITTKLIDQIKSVGYNPNLELDGDLEWNGKDIPADQQIRYKTN
jgi:hypothetical protein